MLTLTGNGRLTRDVELRKRTAWRLAQKRRASPSSARIAVQTCVPMP
jgi:hypothetical protein